MSVDRKLLHALSDEDVLLIWELVSQQCDLDAFETEAEAEAADAVCNKLSAICREHDPFHKETQ